ncbi:MAG: serine protease [Synergistaceae bacterium]|nr:serine protease [Synergistaceae bacterium]
MTLEEACLYLNINPDDDDINLDQLEKNYKTKLSIYDLKRFNNEDSPEYKEAKKMRANIEEAYKYLLDVYAQLHEPEHKETQSDNALLKAAFVITSLAALFLTGIIFYMNSSTQKKPEPVPAPKSEHSYDEKYDALQEQLNDLKKRMEEEQTQKKNQTQNQTQSQNKYADVIEKCRPSMVLIKTIAGQTTGSGSGFIVSENGYILTNHHVISNAEYISVTPYNGRPVEALVKDFDAVNDIALLKVNNLHTNYLRITGTPPKLGEEVIAIGNPQGLFVDSVSNGIVSGFRTLDNISLLQFTAPISQGSSGGAVINLNGEVVGMTKGYWREGQNLNFAVPSDVLTKFLNSAINKPARALANTPAKRNNKAQHEQYKFVRQDDGYEMYLDTESIEYDRQTHIASFVTIWIPTEKSKIEMRRSPDFNIPYGEDVGICALLYNVNFSGNKYVHLRTVNFCTNGTIARDYIKPYDEIIWRTPKRGSRIEALMKEVRKLLR